MKHHGQAMSDQMSMRTTTPNAAAPVPIPPMDAETP